MRAEENQRKETDSVVTHLVDGEPKGKLDGVDYGTDDVGRFAPVFRPLFMHVLKKMIVSHPDSTNHFTQPAQKCFVHTGSLHLRYVTQNIISQLHSLRRHVGHVGSATV